MAGRLDGSASTRNPRRAGEAAQELRVVAPAVSFCMTFRRGIQLAPMSTITWVSS